MILNRSINGFSLFSNPTEGFFPTAFYLQIVSFWAVWQWIGSRIWTSEEEIWRLFSFAAAFFFCFFWKNKTAENEEKLLKNFSPSAIILPAIFILLYATSFGFAPPLARALFAMTALAFTLSRWRFGKIIHAGVFALLLLGLPVIASLNFYLGYPLRLVVGETVEFILRLQGLDVWREGVSLHFGGKLIWIDAPCDGVKMLWFGTFLTSVLACFQRLGNWKTLTAILAAFFVILLGNIFRGSALFYTETGIIEMPEWAHNAIGVVAFAVMGVSIVFIVNGLKDFKWQKYFSS